MPTAAISRFLLPFSDLRRGNSSRLPRASVRPGRRWHHPAVGHRGHAVLMGRREEKRRGRARGGLRGSCRSEAKIGLFRMESDFVQSANGVQRGPQSIEGTQFCRNFNFQLGQVLVKLMYLFTCHLDTYVVQLNLFSMQTGHYIHSRQRIELVLRFNPVALLLPSSVDAYERAGGPGCLQYFTGQTGTFTSFNFPESAVAATSVSPRGQRCHEGRCRRSLKSEFIA